jgi:hypothetical protein
VVRIAPLDLDLGAIFVVVVDICDGESSTLRTFDDDDDDVPKIWRSRAIQSRAVQEKPA